jgi:amidase
MTRFHYLDLTELATLIRTRELSPIAITEAQLERIASLDKALRSYAYVMADEALEQARVAEAQIVAGKYRGPLHGIPIGIKDLCWTQGIPTAAGMQIYRNFRPAQDATVVMRLKRAGAVILGKLQMTEGAYSDYHPTVCAPRNPWNSHYWTGISSSGPAVAVAAGLCFGAIASDTGGSIRWPCSANNLTGLKPTWGRVSRFGVFELAASQDHVGPIARTARDAGAILQVIAGADERDATALPVPVPNYLDVRRADLRGLRIGVDPAWNGDHVDEAVHAVLSKVSDVLVELGAELVELRIPDVRQTVADWAPACAIEAAVAHKATYPSRRAEYGPILAAVLEHGHQLNALDYQEILLRRMVVKGQFEQLLQTVDLLLTPVQPFAPLTLTAVRTLVEQPELIVRLQRYTAPFDMTGHPTITVPGGFDPSGVPIGFQLVAAHLHETELITTAAVFQRETAWHRRHPDVLPGAGIA